MASGGYPGAFEAGKLITGIEEADRMYGVKVFTRDESARGAYYTSGGRVLGVTARGKDLPEAVERAYDAVMKIRFDGMHYRKDIAARGLKHLREREIRLTTEALRHPEYAENNCGFTRKGKEVTL